VSRLLGLTLYRPWTWAILHRGKRVENRSWKPPERQLALGGLIAIHAGQRWDADGAAWIYDNFGARPPRGEGGLIVGVARLIGWRGPHGTNLQSDRRAEVEAALASPWFCGPYGWVLGDVAAIEAIPCKGALGLWRVPDNIAALALERHEAARKVLS
jgi:hypothetical protein